MDIGCAENILAYGANEETSTSGGFLSVVNARTLGSVIISPGSIRVPVTQKYFPTPGIWIFAKGEMFAPGFL